MKQQGFIPIIFLIGVLIISSVGIAGVLYSNKIIPDFTSGNKDQKFTFSPNSSTTSGKSNTPSDTQHLSAFQILLNRLKNSQLTISKPNPSPTVLKTSPFPTALSQNSIPTPIPTLHPTPTPVTNSSPLNPYDLTSATGSVKVMVKAQSGNLAYIPQAELAAVSGFKVLDGRSTDKITQFGRDRTDELRGEIIFSTAPPGPYKVRISYSGSWSEQKDVTVSSAQQSYVEFSVAGVAPTPTPTPKPKPVCSILVLPSSGGTAPYETNVCVGNNSNPYQAVQQQFIDYDGNGSWDYQSSDFGCQSHTFQNPGIYSPKAKIIGASGDESDVCQTTVTIN